MHQLIERAIRFLKKDPHYHLDATLTPLVLWQLLLYRGSMIVRGTLRRWRLSKCGLPLFLGRHVTLRHPHLIRMGKSTIIEDFVTIDALSANGVNLGDNVTIAKYATIQCTGVIRALGEGLTIGNNSAVGAYSFIGAQGGIKIGANVIIGPRVNFHAENHNYADIDKPIRLQGETRKGITIDDDCWIGANSIILDGVHIGSGCVVGAGSVVAQSVPSHSVVVGVPARVVKQRLSNQPV